MKVLRYRLTLVEPALFTTLAGDPNSLVSHEYIPGSAIRGMIIGRWLRQQGKGAAIDAADSAHRRMFFSGATRYLNAHLVIKERRSVPVPASWQTFKYLSAEEHASASESGKEAPSVSIFDGAVKRPPIGRKLTGINGFVTPDNKAVYRKTIRRAINVHSQRGRYTRRRTASVEQLIFRYDAIAADQTFDGAILCDTDETADLLSNLLSEIEHCNLGGARSAGYGQAYLSFDAENDTHEAEAWQEVSTQPSTKPHLLTLLSDTILRDANGQHSPTPEALAHHLKMHGIDCSITPKAVSTIIVGGFNRKWGLPLPQVPALAAGSVFEITALGQSSPDWQTLHWQGIGERRAEGYGRVAIGWQQHDELRGLKDIADTAEPTTTELSSLAEAIWSGTDKHDGLLQRLQTQIIERELVGIVYTPKYRIRGTVTRTQLARLRTVIANELRQPTPTKATLQKFVDSLESKYAARRLQDSRIAGQSLLAWLKDPNFGDDIDPRAQADDRYLLRLVDAALNRAHKEKASQGG